MGFELPKDWMTQALSILKEISEIVSLVKQAADRIEKIEVQVTETKAMVNEIKERSKKLIEKLPSGILK